MIGVRFVLEVGFGGVLRVLGSSRAEGMLDRYSVCRLGCQWFGCFWAVGVWFSVQVEFELKFQWIVVVVVRKSPAIYMVALSLGLSDFGTCSDIKLTNSRLSFAFGKLA